MYCSRCGAQLPDTASFCSNCGQTITSQPIQQTTAASPPSSTQYCSRCGTQLPEAASFCINCGQSIKTRPVQQTMAHPSAYTGGEYIFLPPSMADKLPSLARSQLAKMPAEVQYQFMEEYKRKTKSIAISYILWLIIGLHYLYLGKVGTQFLFWLLVVFTVGVLWWLVDLFRIPGMVRNYNRDIAMNVMRDIKIITS